MRNRYFKLSFLIFLNICFLLAIIPKANAKIAIIKLSYASPQEIVSSIKRLYKNTVNVTAAPMINAIIINANDKEQIYEIKKLIKTLDKKPYMLRYTIKQISNTESTNNRITVSNKNFSLNKNTNHINRNFIKTVTAAEFTKASLTDTQTIIYNSNTIFSNTKVLKSVQGLKISGHVINENCINVNLWYSSGDINKSEHLITSLNVKPGRWFYIGNYSKYLKNTPESNITAENNQINYTRTKDNSHLNTKYMVKIDIISY